MAKACAQVLGWTRRGEAIEILMDLVDRARTDVALGLRRRSADPVRGAPCSLFGHPIGCLIYLRREKLELCRI